MRVAAGVQSAHKDALAKEYMSVIETPTVTLDEQWFNIGLRPFIFLRFSQLIDADAVLQSIHCHIGSNKKNKVLLEALKKSDISTINEEELTKRITTAAEGTWMVIRPSEPLPYQSSVTIHIGPGVPSLEGPLKSTSEIGTVAFTTFPQFAVTGMQLNSYC
jgi:hypothetical protein